jgi:hypothetical protein
MSDPIIGITIDYAQWAKFITVFGTPVAISILLWADNRALKMERQADKTHERMMTKVYLDAQMKSSERMKDLEDRYRELSR